MELSLARKFIELARGFTSQKPSKKLSNIRHNMAYFVMIVVLGYKYEPNSDSNLTIVFFMQFRICSC